MSDDREGRRFDEAMARLGAEVAAHEAEDAPPCESCGKPSDGYSLDDVPLCAECAGALAEVATQEPVRLPLTLGDLQGVVRSPITPAEAASLSGSGARFGDRLREWRAGDSDTRRLLAIADAIDQDAKELREVIGEHRDVSAGFEQQVLRIRRLAVAATHDCSLRADVLAATNDFHSPLNLRRQVDEAVERLRFSAWNSTADDFEQTKNILDVEPFLAELDRIFGERNEGRATRDAARRRENGEA